MCTCRGTLFFLYPAREPLKGLQCSLDRQPLAKGGGKPTHAPLHKTAAGMTVLLTRRSGQVRTRAVEIESMLWAASQPVPQPGQREDIQPPGLPAPSGPVSVTRGIKWSCVSRLRGCLVSYRHRAGEHLGMSLA